MEKQNVHWLHISIFVIISLSLSWTAWFLKNKGFLLILVVLSPLIATFVVRKFIAKEDFKKANLNFRDILKKYWILAVVLPLFWNLTSDIYFLIFKYYELNLEKLYKIYRLPLIIMTTIVWVFSEEIGWRGYLVKKLQVYGRWLAFSLTGMIWFFWHPQYWANMDIDLLGKLIISINIMLLSFILGWLYLESKSIWPCVLMHACNNKLTLSAFKEMMLLKHEPTFIQENLITFIPILIIFIIIFLKGGFKHNHSLNL